MKTTILILIFTVAGLAQQVVAPTQAHVGPPSGDNTSDYNVVNSFETGYRWVTVGGDRDEYRSQVNYGSGIRLLNSSFSMFSRDGHGKFFDELTLNTQGLGNDPYESATLRIAKNNLYRFDMNWRLNDYFNPGLTSAGQQSGNFRDTRFTWQDDDLTLFPQSKIKFFLGYSRSVQDGPEFTSTGGFFAQPQASVLPAGFNEVREATNEYRIGNEFQVLGFTVNWLHGWQDFKEDFLTNSDDSGAPIPPQLLNPYHGTSPYWRVAIFTNRKWFSLNARFTYTGSRREFVAEQSGFLPAAGPNTLQTVTLGNGQRPVATGNLTFSLFLTPKLTFTNTTSVYGVRTEGNAEFLQFNNDTGQILSQDFEYLGIRTIFNQSDLNYQARNWIGFFAGYSYSDRLIRSILGPDAPAYEQTNIVNAGTFGVRLRPIRPLTLLLGGEIGHNSQPFAPKSLREYQSLDARIHYKQKSLTISAYAHSSYNNNSITLTAYASHARTYAANVSWTPFGWLSFNADYVKLHLDTLGGLSFFDNGELPPNQYSLYVSNLHTGNLGVRFAMGKRVELYAGYSHIQDTGDGRSNPLGNGFGTTIPEFQIAQAFPIRYLSPMGRVSIKITNRVRWNAGYQYYGYHEDFFTGQDFLPDRAYRANTGYTSVLWSF